MKNDGPKSGPLILPELDLVPDVLSRKDLEEVQEEIAGDLLARELEAEEDARFGGPVQMWFRSEAERDRYNELVKNDPRYKAA